MKLKGDHTCAVNNELVYKEVRRNDIKEIPMGYHLEINLSDIELDLWSIT